MKSNSPQEKTMGIVGKFLNAVNRFVEAFATATLIFAVTAVFVQIVLRVFGKGGIMQWVWESIILVNVWITYLGASVLSKEEKNINLRAYEILPAVLQDVLKFLVRVIIIATSVVVAMQSYKLMLRQMQNPFVTLPYLTRGHGTLVIVIGFSLMAVYAFHHILTREQHGDSSKERE
jgi:TRAP-type C4-dicarboxylate transport system permease small subunit